ncbi:MAG: hypothetical protein K5891_07055 [Lachnospiraceae bacterium]|nr:hypothetical protein [Lachnospiraceae bacterium]
MGTSCKKMNREKYIEIGFCALLYVTAPFVTAGSGEITSASLAFRLLFLLCFLLWSIGCADLANVGNDDETSLQINEKVVSDALGSGICNLQVGRSAFIAAKIFYGVILATLIWLKPMQGAAIWGICLLLDLIRFLRKQGCVDFIASLAVLVPASLPLYRLLRYLLTGAAWREDLYLGNIQSTGYTFAEFFTTYTNRVGHPGLGLALLAGGVLCFLFLLLGDFRRSASGVRADEHLSREGVIEGNSAEKTARTSLLLAILLCLPAAIHFPWDILQRIAAPIYRAIALLESSSVFLPLAGAALLPACGLAFRRLRRSDEPFLRDVLPILWTFGAIVSSIYRIFGH